MAQAILYFIAIIMIIVGAFPTGVRVNLAVLGAAVALLAYALPVLHAAV